MKDQHKKITGYRDLTQYEIDTMNRLKELESDVTRTLVGIIEVASLENHKPAMRWAAIAKTHLETGFMFAIKAVARPTNGLGAL